MWHGLSRSVKTLWPVAASHRFTASRLAPAKRRPSGLNTTVFILPGPSGRGFFVASSAARC
jgi:hypothetical protein